MYDDLKSTDLEKEEHKLVWESSSKFDLLKKKYDSIFNI